jgi:hypothetical protein
MSDGVRGSIIIIIIGYTLAVLIVLIRDKKNGNNLKRPTTVLFVIWMILCTVYVVYHFLT